MRASLLSIFCLFVAATFFFAPHSAVADNGLTFLSSTNWPQGTGPNQVFGDPAGALFFFFGRIASRTCRGPFDRGSPLLLTNWVV